MDIEYITIPKTWYEELLRVYKESVKQNSVKNTPARILPQIPDPIPPSYTRPNISDYPF